MCDESLEYFSKELTMVKYVYLHPQFTKPYTMKAYRSKQLRSQAFRLGMCAFLKKNPRQLTMWYQAGITTNKTFEGDV